MLQRSYVLAAALAIAFAGSGSVQAASDADLAAIRTQINEMKSSYEQRIAALEQKLISAEAKASRAEVSATAAESAVTQVSNRSSASAFNPEISLILDAKYGNTSRDPASYKIQGFIPNGGEIGPPSRSFSLGESELAISANVDHLFRGNVRFAVSGDAAANTIATEEASIETLSLPAGFKLKAGRFLSGIGYLNQQHPHEWDFVDAPLAYKAFYGSRLSNDGLQVKWIAPTETFLEFGAEVARGGGFPGTERNKNGSGLGTLFAHVGGDLGVSNAWQAGLSYVRTSPRNRSWEDTDSLAATTSNAFSGRSTTWGADFVWKWAPNGNAKYTNFKFQTEYFQRKESGLLAYDDSANSNVYGAVSDSLRTNQSGWYAQSVWQFMPAWRLGYRYDALNSGSFSLGGVVAAADLASLAAYAPRRNSLMLDWSPSEFSRVRLQLARDNSRGLGEIDNQLFVQYIMSLGAHGAHKF